MPAMQHQSLVVVDIETVPDTDAVPNLTGLGRDGEDVAERRFLLEQYHLEITKGQNPFPRQPFHKVVAISFLRAEIDRGDGAEAFYLQELRSGGKTDSSEAELIAGFFRFVEHYRPRLITFNGRGFDLPVLKFRAMVHGVAAPVYYQAGDKWNGYGRRYSDDWHCDLMDVLSDYGAATKIKLNEICSVLGLPGKFGMEGSQVAEYYDAGRLGDIRDYCETDVLNTYLVYLRHMLHRGTLKLDAYNRAIADVISLIEAEKATRPHLGAFLEAWGQASNNRFQLEPQKT
jgi:predicted PolB exonuclease-like 3'-5' exonuclease